MMIRPETLPVAAPRPRVDQSVADDRQERRAEEGADDGAVAPKKVPPMTTAAITVSSSLALAVGETEVRWRS